LLAGAVLLSPAATARPSVPDASPTPIACDVAPRSPVEIAALAEANPTASAPARQLPSGHPADAATTAAIAAAVAKLGACLTAGDMGRFYALHSDAWLRRTLGTIEGLSTLTTSTPPLADGHRATFAGPWHVQLLADGRVLAAVLLRAGDEPRPDPARAKVLIFVNVDERWLVDETIEKVRLPQCDEPVPVAAVVGPPPGVVFDSWLVSCE
jgi:hypothetical protein